MHTNTVPKKKKHLVLKCTWKWVVKQKRSSVTSVKTQNIDLYTYRFVTDGWSLKYLNNIFFHQPL